MIELRDHAHALVPKQLETIAECLERSIGAVDDFSFAEDCGAKLDQVVGAGERDENASVSGNDAPKLGCIQSRGDRRDEIERRIVPGEKAVGIRDDEETFSITARREIDRRR